MNVYTFVMMGISSLWFLSEVMINILTRSKKAEAKSHDQHSVSVLWIVIMLSIAGGVVNAFHYSQFGLVSYCSGMALMVIGITIRFLAIFSLKTYFNANVSIHYDHRLKTDGMYRLVRHPSYTGSLLTFLGLGVSLGNWVSLLIIFMPVLCVFLYRINLEEKVLKQNFKQVYLDYQKRTKRLIPFIY